MRSHWPCLSMKLSLFKSSLRLLQLVSVNLTSYDKKRTDRSKKDSLVWQATSNIAGVLGPSHHTVARMSRGSTKWIREFRKSPAWVLCKARPGRKPCHGNLELRLHQVPAPPQDLSRQSELDRERSHKNRKKTTWCHEHHEHHEHEMVRRVNSQIIYRKPVRNNIQ